MNLTTTRILISNDDGIEAEGIIVLEAIAAELASDVWTVAPLHEQSGVSHSLTLHDPLRVRAFGDQRFAVTGTPSDAVLLAVMEILDRRPGLVLSGINRGANVAEDVTYSGTIAAAMEATLLDIPAVALSLQLKGDSHLTPVDWSAARAHVPAIIRKLAAAEWPSGTLININIPAIASADIRGVKVCPQGRRKIDKEKLHKRQDPRGRDYYWIGGPGCSPHDARPEVDFKLLDAGYITVTPIQLDLTDYALLESLKTAVEE